MAALEGSGQLRLMHCVTAAAERSAVIAVEFLTDCLIVQIGPEVIRTLESALIYQIWVESLTND